MLVRTIVGRGLATPLTIVAAGLLLVIWSDSGQAQGTDTDLANDRWVTTHENLDPVTLPVRLDQLPPSATGTVDLFGNEFSVATSMNWPDDFGTHFHSDDPLTPPAKTMDDIEVGGLAFAEECRGLTEFDLAAAPTAMTATLSFEVALLGGIYGQPFSVFDVEVWSYDGNNLEEIDDYGAIRNFMAAAYSTAGLAVGDVLSFDVTAIYNDALSRAVPALGLRWQAVSNPGEGAVIFQRSVLSIVEQSTPVEPTTWGRVKSTFQE